MLPHLCGLNEAQSRAVQHPPDIPLQILAGPGSGKTRVLTSRIVHLVSVHGVQPASICAVTFTNKAASEMRERLKKMLGDEMVSQIKMGTFHALCARYLRRYATLVGAEGNFTVCDADESKKIISKLLKPYKNVLSRRDITLKEGTVQSRISQAKAKGLSPKDLMDKCFGSSSKQGSGKGKARQMNADPEESEVDDAMFDEDNTTDVISKIVAQVYGRYQETLRDHNSLDFDDLLVYGVRLFKEHNKVANWCHHILVDEFQDTNVMQYDLMRYIASPNRCLTIVGDPDQSIYGWRAAEVENLAKMQRDFSATQQIFLEQNYRSTGSILAASIEVISQDKSRIQKTLHTSHDNGPKPTLRLFGTAELEATCTAIEIKRVIANTGGMLGYNDFSVLLRYNALSRVFESALQKEGIPCKILGGHRFFERLEVKDLLAYLQILDNPRFVPAFTRVINVPARGIGEKSVKEILTTAERLGLSPLEVVERIHDRKIPDIKPPLKRKTAQFVAAVRSLRELVKAGETPATLIRKLLVLVEYEDYLKKTQQDWESRWENVQELINFASEMEGDLATYVANAVALGQDASEDDDWGDVAEDEYDEEELDDLGFAEVKPPDAKAAVEGMTPLRAFLQMTMLSTDTETGADSKEDDKKKDKVTLATCHSAKGLEWPVVFVPAVENGVFPGSRAEDIEEERRLLYVACTRAQCLLYLTHASSRMRNGAPMTPEQSDFVTCLMRPGQPQAFSSNQPVVDLASRSLFATILARPLPEEAEVNKRLSNLRSIGKSLDWPPLFPPMAQDRPAFVRPAPQPNSRRSNATEDTQPPPTAVPTFMSAKSIVTGQSTAVDDYEDTAPMSPSRKFPNRMCAISEPKQGMKSATLNPRKPTKHASNTASKQQRAPESGALTSWLKPKPKSTAIENRPEIQTAVTVSKKATAATASLTPQLSLHQQMRAPARPDNKHPPISSRSSMTTSVALVTQQGMPDASKQASSKRRLGMSRAVVGYPNKKFKSPT